MGKAQRVKGHTFERKVANMFKEIGYPDAKRHLEFQFQEAMGYDIDGTFPYYIQCKKHKAYVPINTIEEVKPQKDGVPVLISEPDRGEAVAVLYLKDFLNLLRKVKGLEIENGNWAQKADMRREDNQIDTDSHGPD